MIRVVAAWANLKMSFGLARPLFGDWHAIPGRFFEIIYNALSDFLPVKSNEFSVLAANQLSDVRALYTIYGARSTVSISADALVFTFPGLLSTEAPLVDEIIARVHDAFPNAFPEVKYKDVTVQLMQHLEFTDKSDNPNDYLARFAFPLPQNTLTDATILRPAGKCDIVAQDQSWHCDLAVERSIANARAIFVAMTVVIKNTDQYSTYVAKADRMRDIIKHCYQLLEVEPADAAW